MDSVTLWPEKALHS
uniref:Uncharacterized protein n=1 Tax=Anguilla anguilla TaxID=7936 RepID=A0A0E9ST71_ANGAN